MGIALLASRLVWQDADLCGVMALQSETCSVPKAVLSLLKRLAFSEQRMFSIDCLEHEMRSEARAVPPAPDAEWGQARGRVSRTWVVENSTCATVNPPLE